jgi:uncharacterized protein (DUF1330 family)
MSAYVIVDIQVHDPIVYEEYKKLAPATVAAYGGQYRVRGGKVETLEGSWAPTRLAVLEFPSAEQARAWLNSPEYSIIKGLRHQATVSEMILVEGV